MVMSGVHACIEKSRENRGAGLHESFPLFATSPPSPLSRTLLKRQLHTRVNKRLEDKHHIPRP